MTSLVIGTVYLLHYTVHVRGNKQHYLGFTQKSLEARLNEHDSGVFGSQMSNLAVKLGSKAIVAKTWEGVSVDFEKKLKRERHLGRYCSLCIALLEVQPAVPEARPVARNAR